MKKFSYFICTFICMSFVFVGKKHDDRLEYMSFDLIKMSKDTDKPIGTAKGVFVVSVDFKSEIAGVYLKTTQDSVETKLSAKIKDYTMLNDDLYTFWMKGKPIESILISYENDNQKTPVVECLILINLVKKYDYYYVMDPATRIK